MEKKYGNEAPKFEVASFYLGHYHYDIDYWKFIWRETKWNCKSDDRDFTIIIEKGKLYDDYQLKDINGWCLEELQKRIDPNIDCISISSNSIFYTDYTDLNGERVFIDYHNKVWRKEDASKIISLLIPIDDIYIRDDNFEKYLIKNDIFSDRNTMHKYAGHHNNRNEKYYEYIESIKKKLQKNDISYLRITVHKYPIISGYTPSVNGEIPSYGYKVLKIDILDLNYDDFYNNDTKKLEEYLDIEGVYMITD